MSAGRWLREPLLHFLLLGALVFGASHYLERSSGTEASRQIQLTLDDLMQLDLYFEAQWRRQPTPEEFNQLVENRVQEEILYREALALGLDKDDTIVKRRMAQKMQFLAEDVAAAHEPDTPELKAWYARNGHGFLMPPRVTFRQVYFSPDRHGDHARDDAVAALRRLAGEPEDKSLADGDASMLQDYYGDVAEAQLIKDFGQSFAQAVLHAKPGSWAGPVESAYGWHLVFVDTIIPGRAPAFEEIEPDVKTAWLADRKEAAWQKAYAAMRAKYTVLIPTPPDAAPDAHANTVASTSKQ